MQWTGDATLTHWSYCCLALSHRSMRLELCPAATAQLCKWFLFELFWTKIIVKYDSQCQLPSPKTFVVWFSPSHTVSFMQETWVTSVSEDGGATTLKRLFNHMERLVRLRYIFYVGNLMMRTQLFYKSSPNWGRYPLIIHRNRKFVSICISFISFKTQLTIRSLIMAEFLDAQPKDVQYTLLKIFKGTVMIFLRGIHRVNFIIFANVLKWLCEHSTRSLFNP